MRRTVLKSALWIAAILTGLIVIGIVFLSFSSLEEGKVEVARSTSPNEKLDAVLIETNGGATTSFGYEVHVVPKGSAVQDSKAAYLYGATRNDHAYGVNLRWKEQGEVLVAEYLQAERVALIMPTVSLEKEKIRVVLQAGVVDNNAPVGGMEYNMRGRR